MSYGRRPFYIIEIAGHILDEERVIEFFGPAPTLRPDGQSALVLRDELAQFIAAADKSGDLRELLLRGRTLLARNDA